MENVIHSRPKRSLVRRIAAPIASLALLSGGGWGAYQYYDSHQSGSDQAHQNGSDQVGEMQPSETHVAAHSAPSAKDNLKLLFSPDDQLTTTTMPTKELAKPVKKVFTEGDRYAQDHVAPTQLSVAPPTLPSLTSEDSQVAEPTLADVAETTPRQLPVGDRYATALTTTDSPEDEFLVAETKQDITRGQEPNGNSLRSANSSATNSDPDASAAFGAAPTQTSNPSSQQTKPEQLAPNRSNNFADALQRARPLQSNQTPRQEQPTNFGSDRYQSAQQLQRPAPPLAIQSSPQQQLPPLGADTLGAPPAGLRTSRVPTTPPLPVGPTLPVEYGNAPQGLTPTPGLANHPGTGRPGESLLEGAQSPSITIQKLAPEEIQVGKRCTFAIRVQNSGRRTAQNVQIRDEVPLGTELVGTAPRATVSGTEIVWDLGTLSPGEERTVEMELLPKEEGELGSVARVSLSAQASAKSRCTRPELALRLTSNPQVHVGDQHVVQIEISNPGSGDATGVMLLETIPAGVSHEAGPALEFEVGTLRAGENRRMDLVLTAEQAGRINNVMTARADASLQVEAGCEFEVIAPELQLSVEGPQRRFLERPATYRVSVDNPGTASAKDVQLVTHLPKGMQFVSANNMGEYDSSSHSVHWSLAELPANERGTVELVALPIESGSQTLQIATKARQGLEDRTDKQVLVEGLSALTFEVTDIEALIEIGQETTYEIHVQNQGSKAATNVQIVAIMPPGIRPLSGQGETRHTVQGERVLFAPLPQLAPKSETTFRIQAQGVRPGDQRVRVQITSDDLQQPITKEVSTRVYADE